MGKPLVGSSDINNPSRGNTPDRVIVNPVDTFPDTGEPHTTRRNIQPVQTTIQYQERKDIPNVTILKYSDLGNVDRDDYNHTFITLLRDASKQNKLITLTENIEIFENYQEHPELDDAWYDGVKVYNYIHKDSDNVYIEQFRDGSETTVRVKNVITNTSDNVYITQREDGGETDIRVKNLITPVSKNVTIAQREDGGETDISVKNEISSANHLATITQTNDGAETVVRVNQDPDKQDTLVTDRQNVTLTPNGNKTTTIRAINNISAATANVTVNQTNDTANTTVGVRNIITSANTYLGVAQSGGGGSTVLTPKKLTAGVGIAVTERNGDILLENTAPDSSTLTYTYLRQGVDYTVTFHNGWYTGPVGAATNQIRLGVVETNLQVALLLTSPTTNNNYWRFQNDAFFANNVLIRHGTAASERPESWMISINFTGDYARFNNYSFQAVSSGGQIFNITAPNANYTPPIRFPAYTGFLSNVAGSNSRLTLTWDSYGDGFNNQLSTLRSYLNNQLNAGITEMGSNGMNVRAECVFYK